MKALAIFIPVLLFTITGALGQNATFVATLDQTTIAAGQQFQISFALSAPDIDGVENFRPPDFKQFVVLGGPFQSTSVQYIDGRGSATVTYSYGLYARQPGKYTVGAATIDIKGTTLRTQPLQIEVVQGKPQSQQKAPDDAEDLANNLLIRATADRLQIKQSEQVTVTYKLYTRVQVEGYDIARAPVYQGFWSEEIEQPKQPTLTTEVYEGKQYRVATIRRTALFPTQTGKLTVSPLEVRCAVQLPSRRRSNDPFDSFFNDPFFSRRQTVEREFRSNPLTITVNPLPGTVPAGFSGAVGRFSFTASVDKKEAKAGDPITLRLSVSGSGNVKLLTLPKPVLPADFEAYEPKISDEITREAGVIRGRKTVEYLVIPRNAGRRVIEPMSFTYFDLDKNTYSTIRSPRFEFTIAPGKEITAAATVASKSDIRLLGKDIRFLKLALGPLRRTGSSLFDSTLFAVVLILPPLAFVGALLYRKHQERLSANLLQLRFQKASKEVSRRLKRARRLLAQGNTESYNAEISNTIMMYLEDKLHISKAYLTVDAAIALLEQRGVPTDATQSLRSCMDRAEFARFAPAADTREARAELLDTVAHAIAETERSLARRR
ncbi:MAG: protein BatD [Ignavibacteria bacterium]|nr:protein BatD [Ignavibacteria bacterium]